MRAIGVVRVSKTKGREGDRFVSPRDQARRIREWCASQDFELVDTFEELDISGGLPLDKRPGMKRAVAEVEAGRVGIVVVAYFERLVRSLKVQHEIVDRVEDAGGRVVAVDAGDISNKTAASWLQGTLVGAFNEYYRRQVREKAGEAQADAIARGVATWDVKIPGYRKGEDGVLVPDDQASVTREAFEMRRDGATIAEVRSFLRGHGVERSYHGVGCLLKSRVVIGELHFGKHSNIRAHEPIVDRDLWNAVQRLRVPRGRKPRSDRLLARLGVVRCGSCGARMVVASSGHGKYWVYRCPPTGDCELHQAVSATITEGLVEDVVKARIAHKTGRAAPERHNREVFARRDRAQADLDAAIRAFAGIEGEVAAIEKITELTAVRDAAQEEADRVAHLNRDLPALTISPDTDWDSLSLAAKRALVKALIESVTISPGRGAERVSISLLEDSTGFRV